MYIRYRYSIGEILQTVATKPTDILNKYHVGQIYIFENTVVKKLTRNMFIQNI